KLTADNVRTRHGGNEAMAPSKLEEDPRLIRLYAGYAFGVDFRERRGHAYMLDDQDVTRRTKEFKQPGACLHCHASIIPTYRKEDYDVNTLATRQELRSFVCGQCHVEYYFKKDTKVVTYPWHNGLKIQQMEAYYDDPAMHGGEPFTDWTHKETGAPLLKAQHP